MTLLTDDASTDSATMATHQVKESPEQPEPEPTPPAATKATSYPSNLIVLLDIDMTMIYTQQFGTKAEAKAYVDGLPTLKQKDDKEVDSNSDSDSKKTTVEYHQIVWEPEVVHINIRPGLKAFLQEVGTTFETHIFTAGTERYAKMVAQMLDPDGTLFGDRIWSTQHCQGNTKNARSCEEIWKDVAKLPFDKNMDRVVLIDDTSSNLKANPGNMIKVRGFTDDPHDKELQRVLGILKDELHDETVDVRPILEKQNKDELWFYNLMAGWR